MVLQSCENSYQAFVLEASNQCMCVFVFRLQDVVLHLTNSQHPGTPQGLNLVVKVKFLIEACIIILNFQHGRNMEKGQNIGLDIQFYNY